LIDTFGHCHYWPFHCLLDYYAIFFQYFRLPLCWLLAAWHYATCHIHNIDITPVIYTAAFPLFRHIIDDYFSLLLPLLYYHLLIGPLLRYKAVIDWCRHADRLIANIDAFHWFDYYCHYWYYYYFRHYYSFFITLRHFIIITLNIGHYYILLTLLLLYFHYFHYYYYYIMAIATYWYGFDFLPLMPHYAIIAYDIISHILMLFGHTFHTSRSAHIH